MKPFDLQAALRGEPVITRKGTNVDRIIYFPEAQKGYRVVALLKDRVPWVVHEDGMYYQCEDIPTDRDLFMATKKKVAWVNLYDYDLLYVSEEEADACAGSDRVGGKAHRIEWEE